MRRKSVYAVNVIITVLLSVGFVLVGMFFYEVSYIRLFEGARDFISSGNYLFAKFSGGNVEPSVIKRSAAFGRILPEDFTGFKFKTVAFVRLFVNKRNFTGWLAVAGAVMLKAAEVLGIAFVAGKLLHKILRRLYNSSNNNYNRDTLPLKLYKGMVESIVSPVVRTVKRYIAFVREHSSIRVVYLGIWAFNLNLVTIAVETVAYLIYFAASMDISSLYVAAVKLITDLRVIVVYAPVIAAVIIVALFNKWREGIALDRLRHYEARNCGVINELPITTLACGSMGKKKTTLITDMALSQEVMFRQRALEIIQRTDMKFLHFPWICFEKELQKCMEYGTVYNIASVKAWVRLKRQRYENHGDVKLQLYGYNVKRYGCTFYDALKESDLFDVLETYAQAYFIYIATSSLIVSNYSIRTDNMCIDCGNLPLWSTDFFTEREQSRHSKILDFDALRLGRKVIEDNRNAGSFEFGTVVITEIGKERGNMLELKEIKRNDEEANQKNDLFNSWLKMCRHSATVDNYPFIKVFCDEQRPESWGADARDLCDIVRITESSEQRLTLPLYTVEEMVSEWAFNKFMRLYTDFRFRRGDNTLLVHLLKGITAWIWRRNIRIYNRYGYSVLHLEKERGTMDGKIEEKKYYLLSGKIYRNRFCTDCFSDYFNELALNTDVGLKDYREYATEKASVEELKLQNSYFVKSLYGGS